MSQKQSITINKKQQSFFITPLDVEREDLNLFISYSADTLESFCSDYDLLDFKSLSASCEVCKWRKSGLLIEGVINAEYTQKCVISLLPVPQKTEIELSQKFTEQNSLQPTKEIEIDPLEDDQPESLEEGKIDLVEFILETFALNLDLYPRLAEAKLDENYISSDALGDESERVSPFAILKEIKKSD